MLSRTEPNRVTLTDKLGLGLAMLVYVSGVLLVVAAPTNQATTQSSPAPTAATGSPTLAVSPDTPQSVPPARHSVSFPLKPTEGFEFKYRLDKGAAMVYSWSASGPVKFELHGEPDGARAGYADTYRTGEDRSAAGLFIAPTRGIHGWYWENPGPTPVNVTLTTSGFYTAALELRPTGTVEHRLER